MDGWGHSLHLPLLHSPLSPPSSHWRWPRSCATLADWQLWLQCIQYIASNTILGDWISFLHLSSFLPFDPSTCLAYILQPSGLWSCYCSRHTCPLQSSYTLQISSLVFSLPLTYAFARLLWLLGNTLLLSGHHTFSPLPSLDSFSLDPIWSVSPLDLLPLQLAIQDGMALVMTDGSYMPT